MIYFSYNDFMDCTENGEIDKIIKVEERIARYEIKNGKNVHKKENEIIEILRNKKQLKLFLDEFLNFCQVENIIYCDNIRSKSDKESINNIICKVKEKEIFIFLKVIQDIDNNISYKMFEHSLNIIKKWNIEEKSENKRHPIVIPIVIYTGKKEWKNNSSKTNNKINYISYEHNKINFSYNVVNISDLNIKDLKQMKSNIAKEFIKLKNKYLQIN